MSGSLGGRAIVVTGASSGIGRAIAEELGRAGAELWLVGRSQTGLDAAAAAIADAGGVPAHLAAIDIGTPGALAALIDGIDHDHLFALLNVAGVMYPEPILGADPARWREMMAINLIAPLEGCQAAVRRMRVHGKPAHLINVGSLAGRFDAGGVYGATKIGLEMITRTLRKELEGDDIRACAIVPGGFRTALGRGLRPDTVAMLGEKMAALGAEPERMFGDPEDIARLARYILEQPINFNIGEVVVRPPASLEF
jgi:NAD(P)-dependent dehydrogenase (short-subunit alcohol dehydrogenase family)